MILPAADPSFRRTAADRIEETRRRYSVGRIIIHHDAKKRC
jgi:hypothetical protein